MPEEWRKNIPLDLRVLFDAADTALYNLHRGLESCLRDLPGKDLWRMVYGMRSDLTMRVMPMCENNLRQRKEPQDGSANPTVPTSG